MLILSRKTPSQKHLDQCLTKYLGTNPAKLTHKIHHHRRMYIQLLIVSGYLWGRGESERKSGEIFILTLGISIHYSPLDPNKKESVLLLLLLLDYRQTHSDPSLVVTPSQG